MIAYSVRKPITVLMGTLIIIVLGIFSVTRLPITLFPDINLPFLVTITPYESASPETVETQVARRIEANVSTIGNFVSVDSISYEHFGISIITFTQSTNMDAVVIELRELLNNVTFPDGVGNTRILRLSPDMLPVMAVTVFRTYDEDWSDERILIENSEWINRELLVDLLSIPGVADVNVTGASDTVLQVNLDTDKLNDYGLSHQEVLETIENQNVGGLIGVALDDGELRMLYLGDQPSTLEQIKALPILYVGSDIITLEELAIEDGINYVNANTNVYSKVNGEQGVQIFFQKQADVSITEVTDNILKRLDAIVADDNENAEYLVLFNQGEFITRSINSVLMNIIIGAVLAIVVLFLFLRDLKPTLIVGLAIPISVIGAFMLMYFSNVSLNIISMGGLALGIGMLVDNAVVVIENIFRMIATGSKKSEAAIEGTKQVAGAITASTLTTIAVFIPIFFIEGLITEVFISMALTIAFALGASLIVALTLVPMMASKLLDDQKPTHDGKVLSKIKRWYEKTMLFTLKYKIVTLLTVAVLLFVSLAVVISRGFILLPESDEGVINIRIEVPSLTPFDNKVTLTDDLNNILLDLKDVELVSATIGGGGFMGPFMGMGGGSNDIRFTVNLLQPRSLTTDEYRQQIEAMIRDLDTTSYGIEIVEFSVTSQNTAQGLGGSQGINIKVSGYNLETLEQIANEIAAIVEETDGVKRVDNGVDQGADNIKITIHRENAITLGMTHQDISKHINYLYHGLSNLGETQTLTLTIEGIDYVVDLPSETLFDFNFSMFGSYRDFLGGILLFDEATQGLIDAYLQTPGAILYIPNFPGLDWYDPSAATMIVNPALRITGGEIVFDPNPFSVEPALKDAFIGRLFEFEVDSDETTDTSIASLALITGFAAINTDGSNRYLNVTGQIDEGQNITIVSENVKQNVTEYLQSDTFKAYGSGYLVTFEGEGEEILDAINELIIAALVAVLLVYMIMAIQFQSLLYPLIILGTIPLAFTGGLMALIVTNAHLSLVSVMGLIILIGIVVNNGIVLIDYINKLIDSGSTVMNAIIVAGQTRMRPIFMTALTTVLALSTLSFGFGEGAEILQPLAITAIGGLIYATVLTLIVVPTIYAMLNRKRIKLEGISHATDQA